MPPFVHDRKQDEEYVLAETGTVHAERADHFQQGHLAYPEDLNPSTDECYLREPSIMANDIGQTRTHCIFQNYIWPAV